MSSHPTARASDRTAATPDAPVKRRRRFALLLWPRRARHLDARLNLRAGVEAPHSYPFEPRF